MNPNPSREQDSVLDNDLEYNHLKPTPVVGPLCKHLWAIEAILLTRTRSATWPITESLQEEIKTDGQRESSKIENLIGLVSRESDIIGQRRVKKKSTRRTLSCFKSEWRETQN